MSENPFLANDPEYIDHLFHDCFWKAQPDLFEFPHCILVGNRRHLEFVLKMVGMKGAVWGRLPRTDEQGFPYLGPDDGEVTTKELRLWELPVNHEYALTEAAYHLIDQFVMVINSRTQQSVLDKINKDDATSYCRSYFDNIAKLAGWVEDLGWAFIPLDTELTNEPYALFVTARRNAHYVEGLKKWLKEQHEECVRVQIVNGERRFVVCN